jgi:hypothetical protein
VDWDIDLGFIVHIAIDKVAVKNRHEPGGVTRTVPHMPFAEDALKRSVVAMVANGVPLPAYQAGYNSWRKAFDNGEAEGWSVTVAECLNGLERAIASSPV